MSRTLPLPRIDSPASFHAEFFLPGRPVIVSGAARAMPAWQRWSDDYLRETVGDIQQLVTLSDERRALMFIRDYLPYLGNPDAYSSSTGPIYMTDLYIRPRFHGPALDRLAADVECPLPLGGAFPESRTVYLGPRGTATPMHQDHFNMRAWMAQLRGDKEWRICPPDAFPAGSFGLVDAFERTDLDCDVYQATVASGDVLYLPPLWWHQARNLNSTIAVYGHFLPLAEARQSLALVLASQEPTKRTWSEVWSAVLALHAAPSERNLALASSS
jgi:hypothetical protein